MCNLGILTCLVSVLILLAVLLGCLCMGVGGGD